MKQFENDVLCKYCLGCNQLESENFEGIKTCNAFVSTKRKEYKKYFNKFIKKRLTSVLK